jgi:hypothetical protein
MGIVKFPVFFHVELHNLLTEFADVMMAHRDVHDGVGRSELQLIVAVLLHQFNIPSLGIVQTNRGDLFLIDFHDDLPFWICLLPNQIYKKMRGLCQPEAVGKGREVSFGATGGVFGSRPE